MTTSAIPKFYDILNKEISPDDKVIFAISLSTWSHNLSIGTVLRLTTNSVVVLRTNSTDLYYLKGRQVALIDADTYVEFKLTKGNND